MIKKRLHFLRADQTFQRPHADAVMGCGEVEEGAAFRRGLEIHGPLREMPAVSGDQRMQQQGRQRELVDHVSLVSVPEIADILRMRDIRFRQEGDVNADEFDKIPHQLHHLVCFIEMDAGGSGPFPEIGNGVQPDDARAVGDIEQEDVQKLEQHIRIGKVEVELVVAERGPEMADPRPRPNFAQQRSAARPHGPAEVQRGVRFQEVFSLRGDAACIGFEPVASA